MIPPRQVRILEYLLLRGPGFLRHLACTELGRQSLRSAPSGARAALVLCRALAGGVDPGLAKKITAWIAKFNTQEAVDAGWQTWLSTRSLPLMAALREVGRTASRPVAARVYSQLASIQPVAEILSNPGPDEVRILAEAVAYSAATLSARAAQALRGIEKNNATDAFCAAWAKSRSPVLETILAEKGWIARRPVETRLLTSLFQNQLGTVLNDDGGMVPALIDASADANPMIAERALACLPALQTQLAIDTFCHAWETKRPPLLEKILLQAHYLPSGPLSLRLRVGFKTGRTGLLRALPPQSVGEWLDCIADSDPTIREAALAAGAELPPESREEVCRLAIYAGRPEAMDGISRHDFRPDSLPDQALLLFLQERWADYALLDFDFNLLENMYAAAPEDLRKRIAARVRSAGRPEFLSILSGGDLRYRATVYSAEEAATLVSILTSNRDFPGLWKLLPLLPLQLSVQSLLFLSSAGWKPENPTERQDLNDWAALASELPNDLIQAAAAVPWALPCASLHVRGRINAIAFASSSPHLAVATGERRLVVWNYAQGSVQTVYRSFSHSLAHAAYAGADLICAERSNTPTDCGIYRCRDGQVGKIGQHSAAVTSLAPLAGNRLISSGRDGKVSIWDYSTSSPSEISTFTAWPRFTLAFPDETLLLTFAASVQAWQLPELVPVRSAPFVRLRAPGYRNSPIVTAAVTLDEAVLLVGHANGRVLAHINPGSVLDLPQALLTTHTGAVKHISFLEHNRFVVTAGIEGQIRRFSWPGMEAVGQINLPEGRLSSLCFAPDGSFMAAGGSEADLTLWDLRMERLRALLRQPLAACTPADLSFADAHSRNPALNAALRRALDLIARILRCRYRFDVQIEEAVSIRPGEFDIIL